MKSRPWYRRFPDNFIGGTAELTLEEKGAYSLALDLIYSRGGPIADEPRWIAGVCNCSVRKWKAIRERLLALGKLVAGDGKLWNERALSELEKAHKQAEKLAENGSKGGDKSAQTRRAAKENSDLAEAPLKHTKKQEARTPKAPTGRGRDFGYGNDEDPIYRDFESNVWSKRWKRKGHEPLPAYRAYLKLPENLRLKCKAAMESSARRIEASSPEEKFRPLLATWINRHGWEADGDDVGIGPQVDWARWVQFYRERTKWNAAALGPEPGMPGCRVPRQYLVGLAAAAQ